MRVKSLKINIFILGIFGIQNQYFNKLLNNELEI